MLTVPDPPSNGNACVRAPGSPGTATIAVGAPSPPGDWETLDRECPVTPLLRCDPRIGATTVSSMDGHIWRWAGNIPPGFEPEFEPRLAHYSKCWSTIVVVTPDDQRPPESIRRRPPLRQTAVDGPPRRRRVALRLPTRIQHIEPVTAAKNLIG